MSRKTVKVITPNETHFYTTRGFAKQMLRAGSAKVVNQRPLVIRLTATLTIFNTLMPEDCEQHKEFFVGQYLLAKTNKPCRAKNKEYAEYQRQRIDRLRRVSDKPKRNGG